MKNSRSHYQSLNQNTLKKMLKYYTAALSLAESSESPGSNRSRSRYKEERRKEWLVFREQEISRLKGKKRLVKRELMMRRLMPRLMS